MPDNEQIPLFHVGLRASCRLLVTGAIEHGIAWEINRYIGEQEGSWQTHETLLVSKDVFDDEDDAKRDAVRTLESLGCCEESPLRLAFRTIVDWMTDEA